MNYTFRMHDPRVGRFLSLDPLSPKYPHNSPYAFSENRVLDGVELEGKEYLNKEECLIEVKYGKAFMKLENFSTTFQKLFNEKHPNGGFYYDNTENIAQLTSELYIVNEVECYKIYEDIRQQSYDESLLEPISTVAEIKEHQKTNYLVYTGRLNNNGTKDLRMSRSMKNYVPQTDVQENTVVSGTTANRSGAAAIGFIELIDIGLNSYMNYVIGEDVVTLNQQFHSTKGSNSPFINTWVDIADAMDKGYLIGYNRNEIDQVFNIVLYGGNGNEPKKVVEKAREIIDDFSGEIAKVNLMIQRMKEYDEKKQNEIFNNESDPNKN